MVKQDQILIRGFPSALADQARAVVEALPGWSHPSFEGRESVSVGGEIVTIPYRVHRPELPDEALAALDTSQQLIAACIYSRHGDGHVRERAIARVLDSTEPWVVPYVIQLLGEYVIEICALILNRAPLSTCGYQQFARANREFVALTEQRANSYWGAYHQVSHPRRRGYPALVALDSLQRHDHAATNETSR